MTPEQITAGARTVTHLADYFEELKQAAGDLVGQATAASRGYFTPSEEEVVRRLQISYWHSRAALFEVVLSFQRDEELPEADRPAGFLVAFAAAVLLVDAARFLRESFEPLPLVRRKLNEPEPHFGIPKHTYDVVQKSLTSPRHAWHLYHAMRYFDERQPRLRRLAADPLLAPVMGVIDRLQSRLQVSTTALAKARLAYRGRRTVSRLQHGLFGRALYGLQKLFSSLAADVYTRPGHKPRLPANVAAALEEVLQPGDVLITRKQYAATNYFLPGYWKHAALYLGPTAGLERLGLATDENVRSRWSKLIACDGQPPQRVLEAMKDGVWIRPVTSPFAADAVVAIRPRLGPDDLAAALSRGLFHEGKPYDFDFDFTRADRLVCTEVVYRSYEGVGQLRFQLTRRAGRLTLSAEDLIDMSLDHTGFDPVAVFAPQWSTKLTHGKQVAATLRATLSME